MKNYLKELALDLILIGAIQFGRFKLKLHEKNPDAPLSPFYIDLRIVRSFPKVMAKIAQVMQDEILCDALKGKTDLLADIPTAATPIVAILMYKSGIPMITPKKDEKTHGISSKIEGKFEPGQRALLIDDLITKADSKLEAAKALKDNGLIVENILVLVDREQGGAKTLKEAGYNLYSVFKITELLDIYLENGKINKQKYDEAISYIREN
jgi:uridine monophosphate synthetase